MRRLYAIVGHPVAHSLSPAMHNAAFEALGLPHSYVPLDIRPGALAEGMNLLRTLGVDGANVTVPHKVDIVPFLTGLRGAAEVIGAVNTLVYDGAGYVGYSTDGEGFMAFLAETGAEVGSAVVLGAGGSARAVAYALALSGAQVTICSRRPEQASGVALLHRGITVGPWDEPPKASLVVNATPLREGLPKISMDEATTAVDLIYREQTDFLARARKAGARTYDGTGMLLHQAAASFVLWTGLSAPIEVMRQALAGPAEEQAGPNT